MSSTVVLATSVRPRAFGDQLARDRLRDDHGRGFFVEAGAGTGKTTALVSRIVSLVSAGRLQMDRLAAITFTEAAASELRGRVRRALEEAAQRVAISPDERERLEQAAGQVDLAAIQTIHSFASGLLRTYAVEAGLPPGFQTFDQIQASLAFDERFRAWLFDEIPSNAPANRRRRDAIRHALQIGITFDKLRDLALAFEENTDLLGDVGFAEDFDRPPLLPCAHAVAADLASLQEYIRLARKGENDPLVAEIRRLELATVGLTMATDESSALAALLGVGKMKRTVGNQKDWDKTATKENPVRLIKSTLERLQAVIDPLIETHRAAALSAVLAYTREFALQGVEQRRHDGVATFHDLLAWARDLLRSNREVRARAQGQFDCIFVDEFQDTDPLQAEIVWFLIDDPDLPPIDEWDEARIVSGKLLVVGDPKQSIYRFRRADIALYGRIYSMAEPDARLSLVQNFRSVPAVLSWINHHFNAVMQGVDGVQAEYVDLEPLPEAFEGHGGVYRVGEKIEGNAAAIRREEAAAVARAIRAIVGQGWQVRDRSGGLREATFADACVLLRNRTNLRNLEQALEAHGVPYRVEGGSLVLDTQEVRELLSCLRAIDDPSDQVAIVAALRSPAYACSDVDLLDWVEGGGRFTYDQSWSNRTGPVAEALESLRAFHENRLDRSVASTIEAFTRERMLAVGTFGQPRPREAWRRLRYVAQQARKLAAAGRPTLRALVNWLDELKRTEFRDVESAVPDADEDAVRLMTIHGAKGLEFPIVFLTGLGTAPTSSARGVQLIPNRANKTIEVGFGAFQTDGFAAAQEREKNLEAAEQIRLLYVAATRARDHLVLCLHHAKPNAPAAKVLELLEGADPSLCNPLAIDDVEPFQRPAFDEEWLPAADFVDDESAETAWLGRREEQVARLTRLPSTTAVQLVIRAAEEVSTAKGEHGQGVADTPEAWPTRRDEFDELLYEDEEVETDPSDSDAAPVAVVLNRSVKIGQAVHQALASIGDSRGDGQNAAVLAARDHGIHDQVENVHRLVQSVRSAPAYQRAIASPRHWHEVPVGVDIGGVLLEGRIDLLWEQPDGSLVILDVKTARIDPSDAVARASLYAPQLGAYALAIQEITGCKVTRLEILFARLDGQVVTFDDVDGLVNRARELVTQSWSPLPSPRKSE